MHKWKLVTHAVHSITHNMCLRHARIPDSVIYSMGKKQSELELFWFTFLSFYTGKGDNFTELFKNEKKGGVLTDLQGWKKCLCRFVKSDITWWNHYLFVYNNSPCELIVLIKIISAPMLYQTTDARSGLKTIYLYSLIPEIAFSLRSKEEDLIKLS